MKEVMDITECTWRVDEASRQLVISFKGGDISKEVVSGTAIWISKNLLPPPIPQPTDLENLVMGEWIWSMNGQDQVANFHLGYDAETGVLGCWFTEKGEIHPS